MLVCGSDKTGIGVSIGSLMQSERDVFVGLKTSAGDRDNRTGRVVGFVRGDARRGALDQTGRIQHLAGAIDAAGDQRFIL